MRGKAAAASTSGAGHLGKEPVRIYINDAGKLWEEV